MLFFNEREGHSILVYTHNSPFFVIVEEEAYETVEAQAQKNEREGEISLLSLPSMEIRGVPFPRHGLLKVERMGYAPFSRLASRDTCCSRVA